MEQGRRSSLRPLAPVALITFAVAFLLVVASSDVDDEESNSSNVSRTTERERPARRETTETSAENETGSGRRTYTVETGDTLAGIAEKTGVTVEQLQELNPELDPQALVSGQKIELRE
jgi:teichoic acid transport system ATP-binding protein